MRNTRPILMLVVVALLAAFSLADTPTKAPAKPKSKPVKPTIKPTTPAKMLLKEIPAVSLPKVPLMRVLKQYGKLSGLTIRADWNALKTVGIKKDTLVVLKARKIRFDKLLDLTLNSIAPKGHPLSWYLDGNVVKVSTQMRILLRNRIALLPLKEARSSRRPARDRRVAIQREINFTRLALKDAVEFLRDLSGANFHVNWRALETTGITRETPVTVKAKNISIARTLDLVTDQLNAGRDRYSSIYWLVRGGVVEISTGEALDRTTSVRVYEIADLLVIIPNFKGPDISLHTTGNNNNANNNTSPFNDDDDDDDDNDEDDSPKEQRAKIRRTLIEIIMFSIGEDMWQPTGKGSIKILRNKMIISQTPLGFKLLGRSMRR
ncbi:MAG: hypothetical protein KAV00_10430 [Phycisphaerae bacterium]|nr:hypothetical protein [Phycisphaerae bacterium]